MFAKQKLWIKFAVFLLLVLVYSGAASLARADWLTYQYDNSRSGSTSEAPPKAPKHAWTITSPAKPISAWDEPALWDGWGKVYDLKNRQVFDKAFHVAVKGERLYFGSSVDDQVHCVDVKTGESLWSFFTEGPVRLAPTIADDQVYFGSDDGYVYCLDASSGELQWKSSPGPTHRRVAGNGRVISPWAVRTSVVIQGDTAYCGAGVIPSEGVYVVALDRATGKEKWKTEMKDLPAQGYMLASQSKLYVVTSRDTPVVLDAETGERLYKVKGGVGGTYALLNGDTLLFGPSKTGNVNMVGAKQETLASFQGNHMIVAQPLSYLQSSDELSSLDREAYVKLYAERGKTSGQKAAAQKKLKKAKDENKDGANDEAIKELETEVQEFTKSLERIGNELKACLKWKTKCIVPYSLVLADGVLIGGGDGEVIAVDAKNGKELWKQEVPGKAYGLAVSDGRLFVSTDEGTIHCFTDDGGSSVPMETLGTRPVRHQAFQGLIEAPDEIPNSIHGPFAEFVSADKVKIEWETTEPMTSKVRFGVELASDKAPEWNQDTITKQHQVIVDNVQPEVVYQFQVGGSPEEGKPVMTAAYRFDSHLKYLPTQVRATAKKTRASGATYRDMAQEILRVAQANSNSPQTNAPPAKSPKSQSPQAHTRMRGYALVVGATDTNIAHALAEDSDLQVVVIEPDATKAKSLRDSLSGTGLYGTRVSVHQTELSEINYGPYLANLIVVASDKTDTSLETLHHALRPAGGLMVAPKAMTQADESRNWNALDVDASSLGAFTMYQRDRLPNTGEWTHQYASADNSACSKDDAIQGSLAVQWWGRPGARPMPDRGNRNPPPVSANGRLYVQGNRTLFGLDAYNGTVLWAKQIPTMRRANMPRDGSNMVAADTHVCVAIHGKCVAFDGQTGKRLKNFEIPEQLAADQPDRDYDWGYVSRIESTLFGSAVRQGSQYLGDKGEWYNSGEVKDTAKVTSDAFFAKNVYSGKTEWFYSAGQIINSTITIADGRVFFVESRNAKAKNADTGRLTEEVLTDEYLVAVDAVTGDLIWEKAFDFSKCRFTTYMTYASDVLLVTGVDAKNVFHTYAFAGSDGGELWQHDAPMKKSHHTGQLAHPTIVGNRVYFNKHTYELKTGKIIGVHNFDWHGCGVMSASNHSVFSRYEYHGMLDLKTNKRTEFLGIRSGCWLSLIPSGGLLLAPETSAGCSCGHSIQTSIAYIPVELLEGSEKKQ